MLISIFQIFFQKIFIQKNNFEKKLSKFKSFKFINRSEKLYA